MADITRWDPFTEFATLRDRLNQLTNQPSGRLGLFRGGEQSLMSPNFIPPVNVYEDEHNINLTVELPGVEEKDIDVSLENNVITITGERKLEDEEKRENFHRIERSYGRFTRSFTLPPTVDTGNVNAEFNNGVLKVSLNKREEAKPKQIKIGVNRAQPKPVKAA